MRQHINLLILFKSCLFMLALARWRSMRSIMASREHMGLQYQYETG